MAREIDESWIEEAIARYRRIESRQAEFEAALVDAEVIVRSPDNAVEVLVNAAGDIREVTLLAAAQGRAVADLSRSIRSAVMSAADAARWAREKLHAEIFDDYRSLEES